MKNENPSIHLLIRLYSDASLDSLVAFDCTVARLRMSEVCQVAESMIKMGKKRAIKKLIDGGVRQWVVNAGKMIKSTL